ncbi:WEB family protein At4g27595, chloroplastic isoform X1 [Carica papaya]|uniref:WEB family protein At4g27595, chloroplastic isoform X1 n=3 Tax=Carica papaya TaxID=3649 RepID=UPI000B8D03A1|nr:WEB family protein At4g27595, chloroplastic isoform X1 [Carica papaya]
MNFMFFHLIEKESLRISKMQKQQQMEQIEEELMKMQKRLSAAEQERDRVMSELRDMKKITEQASLRLNGESMSPKNSMKVADIDTELTKMKGSLDTASQELKIRELNIISLKLELEKAKEWKIKLVEKEALLQKLKDELVDVKSSEAHSLVLLSESKKRIRELEAEVEKGKESETKMLESFVSQTKQLEQAKISLEESKISIGYLLEKLRRYEGSSGENVNDLSEFKSWINKNYVTKEVEDLKSELQSAKMDLIHAQEANQVSSLKIRDLLGQASLLQNEVKSANKAEEDNKKAMDDLAMALKEVAADCAQVKEKLTITEAALKLTEGEAEELQAELKNTEENYKSLLQEARKEAERHKNTADRLRFEAEESLLAWNAKEAGFVDCIKRAEEEKNFACEDKNRLLQSLVTAENLSKRAKEENYKLRDILKQAINEANVAKEAAAIARAENSQLKDALADKEEALHFLTTENENLKINEAAAYENIKELKRLLFEATLASANEVKTEEKENDKKLSYQNSMEKEQKDNKKPVSTTNFHLKEIKVHKPRDTEENPKRSEEDDDDDDDDEDCDSAMTDPLRGSIFDVAAESPDAVPLHWKKSRTLSIDDGETIISEDFDNLDGGHGDETEGAEGARSSRKKKALLRRFGDLLRRKSYYPKSSTEPKSTEPSEASN